MSYRGQPQISYEYVGLPPEQLRAWLVDCQTALHKLETGAKLVSGSYTQGAGGKSVTYTPADMISLRQRIQGLAIALGLAPRRRARQFGF